MLLPLVTNGIDTYLVYCGLTPHESTGEKPSYLLFGVDCRTPTEPAYLPPTSLHPTDVSEYQEELQLSVSVARKLAAESIQKAQKK